MIEKLLLVTLLVILPLQIGRHFWPFFAYIFGLKVDYLSPVIYLQDVFIFFLFMASFKNFLGELKKRKGVLFFIIFFGLVFGNLLAAGSFFTSLFFWLRILEFVFLGLIVRRNSQ